MYCIHGLDENNCPICRISKHLNPPIKIMKDREKLQSFKIEHPLYKERMNKTNGFMEDLIIKDVPNPRIINSPPVILPMNHVPGDVNALFKEKIEKLTVSDPNMASIKEKMSDPELKLE
jgi:hypothetical protein